MVDTKLKALGYELERNLAVDVLEDQAHLLNWVNLMTEPAIGLPEGN